MIGLKVMANVAWPLSGLTLSVLFKVLLAYPLRNGFSKPGFSKPGCVELEIGNGPGCIGCVRCAAVPGANIKNHNSASRCWAYGAESHPFGLVLEVGYVSA